MACKQTHLTNSLNVDLTMKLIGTRITITLKMALLYFLNYYGYKFIINHVNNNKV
jgi:hypothetical protein